MGRSCAVLACYQLWIFKVVFSFYVHSDITDDTLCFLALKNLGKDLPRVQDSIAFQEMI